MAEKHMKVREKHIQRIIERAKSLYKNKNLKLDIKEKDDIERGFQAYFADLHSLSFFEPFGMYCPLTIDQIQQTRKKIPHCC